MERMEVVEERDNKNEKAVPRRNTELGKMKDILVPLPPFRKTAC